MPLRHVPNTVSNLDMPLRDHKLTIVEYDGGFNSHCACGYTYIWRRTTDRIRNEQHAGHLNRVKAAQAKVREAAQAKAKAEKAAAAAERAAAKAAAKANAEAEKASA